MGGVPRRPWLRSWSEPNQPTRRDCTGLLPLLSLRMPSSRARLKTSLLSGARRTSTLLGTTSRRLLRPMAGDWGARGGSVPAHKALKSRGARTPTGYGLFQRSRRRFLSSAHAMPGCTPSVRPSTEGRGTQTPRISSCDSCRQPWPLGTTFSLSRSPPRVHVRVRIRRHTSLGFGSTTA